MLPLWEAPGEAAAVCQAQDDSESLVDAGARPAPLTRALLAAGQALSGLGDTRFLARPADDPHAAAQFLHGPDEALPFTGPARTLHVLRLLSVACGLLAALGAGALARRLLPSRPGAALLAVALLAANPVFLVACAALGDAAPAVACATWALVALADLAADSPRRAGRGLLAGALLGGAWLCGVPLAPLLALALLAALLAARGGGWRATFRPADTLLAGLLIVVGPVLAWRWIGGAPVPADAPAAAAMPAHAADWLARVSWGFVGLPVERVAAGPGVALAWSVMSAVGAAGLLLAVARRREAPGPCGRILLLLLAAVLLACATSLVAALQGRPARGRDLLPAAGAIAALLAAGCAAWLPATRPRLARCAGLLAVVALLAAAAQYEAVALGPAFQPLNRAQDPHLLCFDPLADVPPAQRLATIRVLEPEDCAQQPEPPELRWEPAADPAARYTVHLHTPGAAVPVRTYEDEGRSFRDRCRVPPAVWEHLPPDVELVAQILRLPTAAEVFAGPPLLVDESPPLHLRRGAEGGR